MGDNTVPETQRTNLANVFLMLKSLVIDDLVRFDFMDPPPFEALSKALELLFALSALNKHGDLTKVGRRMAEFPLDLMLSKMTVASAEYKCSNEIITIAAMLSVGSSIFFPPKDKKAEADNAPMNFHVGSVGDHIALVRVFNSWKETDYSEAWCDHNHIQVRSMKRAKDIRQQLEGLLERAKTELTSSPNDLEAIKRPITSGFFSHSAKLLHHSPNLHEDVAYQTVKHPETVYIHPSSELAQAQVPPRLVVYHELITANKYMRIVTEIKPEWLLEIAPRYYQCKEVEHLKFEETSSRKGRATRA